MSRSIRRHHKARLVKKLRRDDYYGFVSDSDRSSALNNIDHNYKKNANNPKRCSCFMCGNPRKWSKGDESLTLQERKAQKSHSDYLKDLS